LLANWSLIISLGIGKKQKNKHLAAKLVDSVFNLTPVHY